MHAITNFNSGSVSPSHSLVGPGITYRALLMGWFVCIRDHIWSWCKVSFLRLCMTLSLCAILHTEGLCPHHLQQFHRYIVWLSWQLGPTTNHAGYSPLANFHNLSVPNSATNLIGWRMKISIMIFHSLSIAEIITISLTSWPTLILTACLRVGTV